MERILTPTNYELIPLNDLTNVRFYTSVDTGSYIASHWHDAVEIIYLLEGGTDDYRGEFFVSDLCGTVCDDHAEPDPLNPLRPAEPRDCIPDPGGVYGKVYSGCEADAVCVSRSGGDADYADEGETVQRHSPQDAGPR